MRQQINKGRSNYNPNSLGGGCPYQAKMMEGGFTSYAEKIDAHKVRQRSASFFDHFSQAKMFYNSQSDPEKAHMVDAFSSELGKVETIAVRQRMLRILSKVDKGLAAKVAYNLGLHVPTDKDIAEPLNQSIPADGNPADFQPVIKEPSLAASPALSMANTAKDSIRSRKIAILVADGVDGAAVESMRTALKNEGAVAEVIAPKFGLIATTGEAELLADKSLLTTASVLYDAVFVPEGANSVAFLEADPDAVHFLDEAYRHCKVIAADPGALQVLRATRFGRKFPEAVTADMPIDAGIIINSDRAQLEQQFINSGSAAQGLGKGRGKKSTGIKSVMDLNNPVYSMYENRFLFSKTLRQTILQQAQCILPFLKWNSLETHLGPHIVNAVEPGTAAVCVFVNDRVTKEVIKVLAEKGVKIIALRCAGFNNIDLPAAREYGVQVCRVPAYSPQAVAEHAAAMLLTLNRKIHKAYNRVREQNFSLNGLLGFNLYGKTAGSDRHGKRSDRLFAR